jgi:hypothetical protein
MTKGFIVFRRFGSKNEYKPFSDLESKTALQIAELLHISYFQMGGFPPITSVVFSEYPLPWSNGFKWQMVKCCMLSATALSNYCSSKPVITPVLYSDYVN